MLKSLINQRLGRYIITALLGRGGMAAVYRATDSVLQRDVALKVLYPHYSDDAGLLERFKREAVTAAALEHPAIVPVYDVSEQDGMAFIAMKLLTGRTFQDRLQEAGPIDAAELLAVLGPVAAALDYAHGRGVIHRDIKPANIFLNAGADGERPLLTDFGIAKQLDTPGLTTTGALIGTPDYMAPEQITGGAIDARTDLYALGMMAYRALTGRRAFEGSTQDVLLGHLYRRPPLPSELRPALGSAVDTVLMRAIAVDPAERYASAGAFVGALQRAAAGITAGTVVGRPPALAAAGAAGAYSPSGVATPPPRPPTTVRPAAPPPPSRATTPTSQFAERSAATAAASVAQPAQPPAGRAAAPARGGAAPWILALILAAVAGALAAALGFALASPREASGGLSPLPLVDTATASPTLAAEPSPTLTLESSPTLTLEPSPTAAAEPTLTAASAPSSTPAPPTVAPAPPSPVPPSPAPSRTTAPSATATVAPPTATATDTPALPTDTPVAECDQTLLQGGFGKLYNDDVAVRVELGCPTGPEVAGAASEQFFERGTMYWWGQNSTRLRDTIFVFYGQDSGEYTRYSAEQVAELGKPARPDDPDAPDRGFGAVYFNAAGVAGRLGDWTSPEIELKGENAGVIQFYERGLMLYTPAYTPENNASIFVLYDGGGFDRYADPLGG